MRDWEGLLRFWFDEIGRDGWYNGGEKVDAACRDRYLDLWNEARDGGLREWIIAPRSGLALIILLDQFPRNMFRGSATSFATDARAMAGAKWMLGRGLDATLEPVARQFIRLPLIHSESLQDQEQGIRRCLLGKASADEVRHARAHREVIRRFGRFPFRNAALGRVSSRAETDWLAGGGYAAALRAVS
ncbi:DUF924 family protein [Amaricoccus sp.]|uniref:DUF924 family protein n=1 Tax=Amaricoccus sp. TaxID=1872485 RepID=UPI001B5256F2|nr:DUF924 family protein [Amaricoccus sp.]MBP7240955.1 DUF924 domain-containing protein [Amaricoccus sp.]